MSQLKLAICTTDHEWKHAKSLRNKNFFDPHKIQDPYCWTFDHKDHKHFILYKDAEIIGYAHLQLWKDLRTALRIIAIDNPLRNQSYGSQMMHMIESWTKTHGYTAIHIESSPEAFKFYTRLNYISMPFNDPDGYEGLCCINSKF